MSGEDVMGDAQNTRVVQEAYAAFGRGDVPGILATLDDNIVWKAVYGAAPHVPTAGERRGKAAVGEFFAIVGKTMQFERFEPREFIEQGNRVAAFGYYEAKTSTGKRLDSEWVMLFTFRNGKIAEFQEFTNTAMLNAAFERVAVS
jgi:ketosteroid isomerase-like protein